MTRLLLAIALILAPAAAQDAKFSKVTRDDGGSIKTELRTRGGGGIFVNESSSLRREWITVHEDSVPADIVGTTGVKLAFITDEFFYTAAWAIQTKEALTAVEVRFLLFDIWGNHMETLSTTKVTDFNDGGKLEFSGRWRHGVDAAEFYASIAYVARIRTKDGRVVNGDVRTVLEEARKFSKKFMPQDLEPKEPKKGLTI